MGKQVIIWGIDDSDVLQFFSLDNIICFVDNNEEMTGKKLYGKDIISDKELKNIYFLNLKSWQNVDVIIANFQTRWSMFAVADQLKKMGIQDFSVYRDIKRRWRNGREFIERDRKKYPCEQESVLEIYSAQLDYLKRHTDPRYLLPATGELRQKQIDAITHAHIFFEGIAYMDIRPFMLAGTLIGAIRHKGFIPWDDDLDFGMISDEYNRLIEYGKKKLKVFYRIGKDNWKTSDGEKNCDPEKYPYILALGYGYMRIWHNLGADSVIKNELVCDLFPVYYINDNFTKEMYKKEFEYWKRERKYNYEQIDAIYQKMISNKNIFVKRSEHCGYGFDLASVLACWGEAGGRKANTGYWNIYNLFPLKKIPFDRFEFWAPNRPVEWLEEEGNYAPMDYPSRVGVYVHDKDRIFTEKY